MEKALYAIAFAYAVSGCASISAADPPAEQTPLKDGSTLDLHPDCTSRMIDQHGEAIKMNDGVEMELADGRTIIMDSKKVWVKYGPPGKGRTVRKND